MKIKYKPKQSTNNSTKRIIRDSNPKAIVGTLVGFILVCVVSIIVVVVGGGNNNVFAASYEYSIKYNDNVVDNMPMDVNDGRAVGGNLSLANETPTRSGYKFLGWCNTIPSTNTTDNTDSCSGTTYQPSAGITIASAADFHFYALWEKVTTLADITYMQDTFSCADTPTGTSKTLADKRDNEQYSVRKLADGNCWMLDNLRLDPTTVALDKLQGNTNASDTTLGYFKNGGGSSPYTGTAVSQGTINSYNLPQVATAYKGNDATVKYGPGSGKTGVYYNYCAASAGSWCYASGQPSSDPDTSTLIDAKEDLCPAGWRMPTSTSNGEYQTLRSKYSSTTATATTSLQYNLSTPLSGYFFGSSQRSLGSYGNFWSSTYYDGSNMYGLFVDASNVRPSNGIGRGSGRSIRCIAQ